MVINCSAYKNTHTVNLGAYSVEILTERFSLSNFDNMRSLCV